MLFAEMLMLHVENYLMRIFLQTNLCFITRDAFEILRYYVISLFVVAENGHLLFDALTSCFYPMT